MRNDNNSIYEWINLNEEAQSTFTFSLTISFTKDLTEEQALMLVQQYIKNSAEKVIVQDKHNMLPHLQRISIEAKKLDNE